MSRATCSMHQPRWHLSSGRLGRILIVVAIVVVLVLARLGIGFGAAAWHYMTETPFAEYLSAHPVSGATLGGELVDAALVADALPWAIGDVDPFTIRDDDKGTHHRAGFEFEVKISHADDTLLHLDMDLAWALRRAEWQRDGFAVRTETLKTHGDVRAVVRIYVRSEEALVADDSWYPIKVEVFVMSGGGDDNLEVVRLPEGGLPGMVESDRGGFGLGWLLFGAFHPTDSAPDSGLIYRVRQTLYPSWKKLDGGSEGAGVGHAQFRANSDQYSYQVEVRTSWGEHGTRSLTARTWRLTWRWNDEIW